MYKSCIPHVGQINCWLSLYNYLQCIISDCFSIDQHPSKPLISLVPITCTTYCFQGYGYCYADHHPFCFPSKSQTLFGIGAGPPMFLESIGSHLTLFKCNWILEIYCNVMNNTCMNVIIIAKPLTPEYKHWII